MDNTENAFVNMLGVYLRTIPEYISADIREAITAGILGIIMV